MNEVIYYNHGVPTPDKQPSVLAAISSAVSSAIANLSPVPGDNLLIEYAIGTATDLTLGAKSEKIYLELTRLEGNEFSLAVINENGQAVSQIDNGAGNNNFFDSAVIANGLTSAATGAITIGIAAVLAVPLSAVVTMALISGGVTYLYSKVQGPESLEILVDQIFGTTDVKFELFDNSGTLLSSALYEDGIAENEWPQAVQSFLNVSGEPSVSDTGLIGADFAIPTNGMQIRVTKIDSLNFDGSAPNPDEVYIVYTDQNDDGSVTSHMAEDIIANVFNGDTTAFKLFGNISNNLNGDLFFEKTITVEDENDPNNTTNLNHSWIFARDLGNEVVEGGQGIGPFSARPDYIYVPNLEEGGALGFHPSDILTGETTIEGDGDRNLIIGTEEKDSLQGGGDSDYLIGGLGSDDFFAWSNILGLDGDYYFGGSIAGSVAKFNTLIQS